MNMGKETGPQGDTVTFLGEHGKLQIESLEAGALRVSAGGARFPNPQHVRRASAGPSRVHWWVPAPKGLRFCSSTKGSRLFLQPCF